MSYALGQYPADFKDWFETDSSFTLHIKQEDAVFTVSKKFEMADLTITHHTFTKGSFKMQSRGHLFPKLLLLLSVYVYFNIIYK